MALVFSFVEFSHTIVGLWQLHVFRHWVAARIRSLESLGYVALNRTVEINEKINDGGKDGDSGDYQYENSDGSSDAEESEGDLPSRTAKSRTASRTALEIADGLTINDLVVDNRLSEGEIQCILRVRNSTKDLNWRQRLSNSARWLSCIWHFPHLLFAICRSKDIP